VTDSNHPGSSDEAKAPAAPTGAEYQDILSGVMKDEKQRKAAGAAAAKRQQEKGRGQGNQPLMLGILALVSGYLWLGQPSFLEPEPLDPISVELSEASLRIDMTMFITRISQFEATNGRFPASLGEAWEGEDRPGYVYEAHPGGFTLAGSEGEISLAYDSSQDVVEFMGDAMRVIREGAE
jgi:hypothetical protein